jgi:integrase
VVRSTKFGKDRQVPLHPTSTAALDGYLKEGDRHVPQADTSAVFVSIAGTRLRYCNVNWTFLKLVEHAGYIRRWRALRLEVPTSVARGEPGAQRSNLAHRAYSLKLNLAAMGPHLR